LSWPGGASSNASQLTEHPHVRPPPSRCPPPRRKRPTVVSKPLELWARLPAERQRQLRQLLGQLLARRLEAVRLGEGGHE